MASKTAIARTIVTTISIVSTNSTSNDFDSSLQNYNHPQPVFPDSQYKDGLNYSLSVQILSNISKYIYKYVQYFAF